MLFNAGGSISSEKVSKDYLAVNSCGIENLFEYDVGSRRLQGRTDYHILYIQGGACYLRSTHLDPNAVSAWTEMPAGSIIFFRPGEPQEYFFRAEDRSVSHYIHFSGRGCAEILKTLELDSVRTFFMGKSRSYEEVSARMVREYTMKRPFWEQACAAYLYELLSIIARKKNLRRSHIDYSGEHRINAACRKIYENLDHPPSVSELAAACCLSVSRFSHLFRQVTGKSPLEFTKSMQLERARELLSATDLSIREISEMLHFSDQNYFSRVFKRGIGMSPREWRKREKGRDENNDHASF